VCFSPLADTERFALLATPLGPVLALARDEALSVLALFDDRENGFRSVRERYPSAVEDVSHPVLAATRRQLEEYFTGRRREFDLPLAPAGTDFQQRVWRLLREILYGETRSYGDLARAIGAPGAAQAIGQANGENPIAVIIPCHRVIAAGGGLGGYGGGLDHKRWLLRLEGSWPPAAAERRDQLALPFER
jgi:methylated-DNA-[protein]-cysteine S-methyltransferase